MTGKSGREKNFIRNLNVVLSEFLNDNPEELDEELREEGINHEEIISKGMELIRKLKIEQRRAIAKDKKSRILNIIYDITQQSKHITKQMFKDKVYEYIPGAEKDVAVQTFFRSLDEISEEDFPEMMNQINIMKILKDSLDKDSKIKGNNG